MIKVTAYSLKALLVVPLIFGLVDALLAVPGASSLVGSYVPFVSPRLLFLAVFGALLVSASVMGRTARIIKFLSWVYVLPPILVLGVFNRVMNAFGVEFHPWDLNLSYLVYFVIALPLAHLLDDTVERAKRFEEWGVEGYDPALHGVLGSLVLVLLSAGLLTLVYYREANLSLSLPPYSLMLVVFVLGLSALIGFLPEGARRTVAFVKVKATLGPAYDVSVIRGGDGLTIEVRDYGTRQERELTYSFEIEGKPPQSILLDLGETSRRIRKSGETVVDGVRYVVYSNVPVEKV